MANVPPAADIKTTEIGELIMAAELEERVNLANSALGLLQTLALLGGGSEFALTSQVMARICEVCVIASNPEGA